MNNYSSQISILKCTCTYILYSPFLYQMGFFHEYLFIFEMNNYSSQSVLAFQQSDEVEQDFTQHQK